MNIKWNWVKFLQIANFYNLKEQLLKSSQLSHQVHAVETEERTTYKSSQQLQRLLSFKLRQLCHNILQFKKFRSKNQQTKIKDALSLEGKANQESNQFRRNMIKPYLPPQFAKLADISDDSKNFLFGDLIADTILSLRKKNQTKFLIRDNLNRPT